MNNNLIERLISHADVLEQQYDPMVGAFDSTIALLREAAREMDATGKLEQCEKKSMYIDVHVAFPPYHEEKCFVELDVVKELFS